MPLGMVRPLLARQRTNLPAAAEEAQRLRVVADAPDTAPLGLSEGTRAPALITWVSPSTGRPPRGGGPPGHGITLARRIGLLYLEFLGLAHRTSMASVRSSPYALAEERARQTGERPRRHG